MTAPTPEQMRALMNTPLTPEQYRALAHRALPADQHMTWSAVLTRDLASFHIALRIAAEQIDVLHGRVRDYYYENGFTESAADHLIAFLTADTAPQGDR